MPEVPLGFVLSREGRYFVPENDDDCLSTQDLAKLPILDDYSQGDEVYYCGDQPTLFGHRAYITRTHNASYDLRFFKLEMSDGSGPAIRLYVDAHNLRPAEFHKPEYDKEAFRELFNSMLQDA